MNFDEVDWDDHARVFHDGQPFTGEVVETARDGQVIAVTRYLDGIEDGPSEERYPTGELKARGTASHGRAVGSHQQWYRNGQPVSEAQFDENGRQLARREWDEAGNLTLEKIYDQ